MEAKNEHSCLNGDDLLTNAKLNIDKFGLQVIMVNSANYLPSFVYSVGLTETYNHPEIICFGLPTDLGHNIINDIAQLIKVGERIDTEKVYTEIFKNSRAKFLKIDNENIIDYFGVAINYYSRNNFNALQLVWTDRNDKFLWEENFEEEFLYKQPLLDRNANFRFYEPKNLATFTTRQWLDEQKPILRVVHDIDGDWQFLTGDQLPEDIRIVGLEELIKRDNTLNQIFDLEYGEEAERTSLGERWVRNEVEPKE